MQLSAAIQAPTLVSTRKLFKRKISDLHKCNNLHHVKQIHALIYKFDLHNDLYVAPKLITAFSLCYQLVLAVQVFNQIEKPNVCVYNAMIRALIRNSQPSQAFAVFFEMQKRGVFPDNYTYPFLLKACSGKSWLQTIRMVHSHIEKFGFYTDIYVPNSLIDAYSKCGSVGISESKKLFGVMVERDTVSWNSMMGGLVKAGELGVARELFDEMPERNTVSWNTMLDGHAKAGEMNKAFSLFEKMPIRNVVSWSTMVAGYSKVGDMWMARMLFDKMPVKNLVSWTIIISGYAKKGLAEEAIKLYNQMEVIGLKLDDATILSILAACAESGLLGLGEMVHNSIKSKAYKCNLHVCNALIHMYAKCGRLSMALNVFNSMKKRDLVSWNAVIHGLAMNGYGGKALKFFSRMKQEGFTPDKVTFIGVLCACSHAKLVNEGIHYFLTMESDFGVVPEIEHYGCMIDLLGRGGRLKEAYKLVHSMPFEPNVIIWGALLGACRMHNAVELAEEVLSNLIKLEPIGAENIDMLSCIHSADGNWGNVENVRLRERIHNLKALDQTPQV